MPDFKIWEQTLTVQSPLRIGFHQLGTIQRSRCYVPASAIIGAFAAAWARSGAFGQGTQAYAKALNEIHAKLRFTYFFVRKDGQWLRPKYQTNGLRYGADSANSFESAYLTEQASAALDPATLTAADGQLHESEALWKPGLQLCGYVLGTEAADWPELLNKSGNAVRLGADRSYGWGEVKVGVPRPYTGERIFDSFKPSAFNLVDVTDKDAHLPAHARATCDASGDIEYFGGREWLETTGPGRTVLPPSLCWTPGSRLAADTSFEIEPRGIWNPQQSTNV